MSAAAPLYPSQGSPSSPAPRNTRLRVERRESPGGPLVLAAWGDLDIATAPVLRRAARAAAEAAAGRADTAGAGRCSLVLDVTGVTSADSAGVAALLTTLTVLGAAGTAACRAEDGPVLRALRSLGIDRAFPVLVVAAVRSVSFGSQKGGPAAGRKEFL